MKRNSFSFCIGPEVEDIQQLEPVCGIAGGGAKEGGIPGKEKERRGGGKGTHVMPHVHTQNHSLYFWHNVFREPRIFPGTQLCPAL